MSDIHQIVSRQINRWNLDRKVLKERLEKEEASPATHPAQLKPVVTLSRQRGCRGRELAKLLAHELNYGLFDREIIEYISHHIGVRSEFVEALEERDRSELELWVEGLLKNRIVDHDDYIRALSEVVKTASLQGGLVILGRGANYMLSETSSYRVRLVAPDALRVRNLVETEGMPEHQGMEEIWRADLEREQFIMRYFQKNINLPEDYDLIINLAGHTMNGVVKIILSAMRARGWAMELTGGDKRSPRRNP